MSKIKNHYWDILIDDNLDADASEYDLQRALHYHGTVNDIVALMQQYSVQTVLMDVFKNLESKEIK